MPGREKEREVLWSFEKELCAAGRQSWVKAGSKLCWYCRDENERLVVLPQLMLVLQPWWISIGDFYARKSWYCELLVNHSWNAADRR